MSFPLQLDSNIINAGLNAKAAVNSAMETPARAPNEDPDVEQGDVDFPGGPDEHEHGSGRGQLGMIKEHTPSEIAAGTLALFSVSAAVASMFIAGGLFVNIAGILCVLIGPYSYWQQKNITDVRALMETHMALKAEVNRYENENIRLKGCVDDLGGAIKNLEDVEETFEHINEMNIESIEELATQVEEGKDILAAMKKNLKASALQNIITVVLNSDKDGNYEFDNGEVEQLITNLKAINGMQLNEQKFREVIKKYNGSVEAVVTILEDITRGNSNENEAIFKMLD
jgi:hypothetical protein